MLNKSSGNAPNFFMASVGTTPKDSNSKPSNFFTNSHKILSNIFSYSEKNQINEVISGLMELRAYSPNLSKEFASKTDLIKLIRICNRILVSLSQENLKQINEILVLLKYLIKLFESTDDETANELQLASLNTYGVGLLLKSADKNYSSSALNSLLSGLNLIHYCKNQILIGITYNNLAAFSLFQNEYEEAFRYSEKGLTLLEAYVFKKIQKNDIYDFSKNEQFLNELVILLAAYMNFGVSLRYFQNNPHKSKNLKLPPKKYDSFFVNGYKLGMKYLGSKHIMTQKLNILCRVSKTTTTAQTLPDLILTEDEHENLSKIHIQGNYTSRSKEQFKWRKSHEFEKDLTSFCTQSQSSFNNDESLNDFQMKNPRNFRIKKKPYNNYGLTHLKNEFSNNYVKQIKDMEETLYEIQKMREFYEQEKKNLEEKNLKKQLELGYVNPGINYYGMNINNTSNNIHSTNSLAGHLQNNFMVHPNNFQQTNPFFFSNFQHHNNNNIYNHPNVSNNGENAMIPTQKIEQINSKQNDLEQKLENLKRENEDILKEKFLKQQELNELKKMVEELKEKSKKKSFESETSIKDNLNLLHLNKEQIMPKEKQSISPCSSYKNLDIDKLKDNKYEKKENEGEGRLSHKDLKEMESPEIIAKLRNKNPPNNNKGDNNSKKQLIDLMNPLNDEKELLFRKVESVTLKPQEIKNNKGALQPDPSSLLNKTLSKIDSNQISRNNISNNNDSECFSNAMKKKPSVQKKSLRFEKKISSSDQMLPDTNDNNKLHLKKQQKSNQHRKIPSIDFIFDASNPGTLLQFFLPSFPRGFQIKKKLIFNNMNFTIDLTLLDEPEQIFFVLRGVNETKKMNLAEEKVPAELFSKILQTIDVKDVLPYEIPLKTIETFEFFMKFCVLPFIGIGIKEGAQSIEVWPKAHGIYLDLITINFFGEECFLFFHHIMRDEFRVVGKNIRIDINLDQTTINKLFEFQPSKGGKNEELENIINFSKSETETKNILQKLTAYRQKDSIQLEFYKILNIKEFIALIEKIIKDFEEFLKDKPKIKSFFDIISENSIILNKVNIWNNGSKYRMYFLKENNDLKLQIFLKNGFESHAPNKKKVRVEGQTTIQFNDIWKTYGVFLRSMDLNDKTIIASLILEGYTLQTFDKELDEDDYDRFDENSILPIPIEHFGFLRVYIGDAYKIPLTITLLGLENIPVGLKITIFDHTLKMESGIFLTVNHHLWKKEEKEKEKMKKLKYKAITTLEENYEIVNFLKHYGFDYIYNSLIVEKKSKNYEITGKLNLKNSSVCDSFENLLSIPSFIQYLQKKM